MKHTALMQKIEKLNKQAQFGQAAYQAQQKAKSKKPGVPEAPKVEHPEIPLMTANPVALDAPAASEPAKKSSLQDKIDALQSFALGGGALTTPVPTAQWQTPGVESNLWGTPPASKTINTPTVNMISKMPAAKPATQSDPWVAGLQRFLVANGHPLHYGADGKMGAETANALKRWQGDNGLAETGQLDQATLAALQPLLTPYIAQNAVSGGQAGTAIASTRLNQRIALLERLAKYGDRKDFLDAIAQAVEPKFTQGQEDRYYGVEPVKSPSALPTPISLHAPKPSTESGRAALPKASPPSVAPDLQQQLMDAFGPDYVPPKEASHKNRAAFLEHVAQNQTLQPFKGKTDMPAVKNQGPYVDPTQHHYVENDGTLEGEDLTDLEHDELVAGGHQLMQAIPTVNIVGNPPTGSRVAK